MKELVTGSVLEILNRLLEHKNFPRLISLIRIYFQDTAARGIMARNQLIQLATASLSDLMKEHPQHRAEARQDLQFLNAQKMGEHEAEIEKSRMYSLLSCEILRKIWKVGNSRGSCDRCYVPDHARRTCRTKTGTAFYGRCNCYDCRTDWAASSDGRGNKRTISSVDEKDN